MARKKRSKEILALYKNIENEPLMVSLRLRTIMAFRGHLREWESLFKGLDSFKDTSESFGEMHAHIDECEEIIARCVRNGSAGENAIDVQLSEYMSELPNESFYGLSSVKPQDTEFSNFHGDVEKLLGKLLVDLEESFRCFGRIMGGSSGEDELLLHKPFRSKKTMSN